MKAATGKPPRKSRRSKPAEKFPLFDVQLRHTVDAAGHYLKASRPTIYKLIHAGLLETVKEGRRTYITGRSIAARSLPPT